MTLIVLQRYRSRLGAEGGHPIEEEKEVGAFEIPNEYKEVYTSQIVEEIYKEKGAQKPKKVPKYAIDR